MASRRPPKPTPTREMDGQEIARLAAESAPPAEVLELQRTIEDLRRNLQTSRAREALLDALLADLSARLDVVCAENEAMRAKVRAAMP